jgi:hypothetical protein
MENTTQSDEGQKQGVDQPDLDEDSNDGKIGQMNPFTDRNYEDPHLAAAVMPSWAVANGRVERKRKMNAIQSRRKRERQKAVIENLRMKCADYSIRNFDLYQKNHSLDVLLQQARNTVDSYNKQQASTNKSGISMSQERCATTKTIEHVVPAPMPPTTSAQLSNILLQLLSSTRRSSETSVFGSLDQSGESISNTNIESGPAVSHKSAIRVQSDFILPRANAFLETPHTNVFNQVTDPIFNSFQLSEWNASQFDTFPSVNQELNNPKYIAANDEKINRDDGLLNNNEDLNLALLAHLFPLETLLRGPIDQDLLFQTLIPTLLLQISGVDPTKMLQQKIRQHVSTILSLLRQQHLETQATLAENGMTNPTASALNAAYVEVEALPDSVHSKLETDVALRSNSDRINESIQQLAQNWLNYMLRSSPGKSENT